MTDDGAVAGPRAVIGRWLQAFLAADVEAITALYAPDATFFGTSGQNLVLDNAGVRRYFERALTWARPVRAELLEESAKVVIPGMAVVCGLDAVAWSDEGRTVTSEGRVSFVLRETNEGWRIVHFHRSALPTIRN
jgi:uncharacterized protein (TIGR02246 family)